MTEPTRLLEDPNAPEEAASLLRSLSAPVAPSAAKQAALAQQLASLASPAAAATASTGVSGTALWLKAAVVCGVVGLGALAAVKLGGHVQSPAPQASVVAPATSPAPVAPPADTRPNAPVVEESPAAPAESVAAPLPSSARAKAPARDTLADEEALLEQARRASTSSPSQALALLSQYQRRFPNGQLTAERMFLGVDVLTRLGNAKAARKQADALIRAFPTSVYAAQVKGQSSNSGK